MEDEKVRRCLKTSVVLAILSSVIMFFVGFFYERKEYSNYLEKKAEVEAEVSEWKQKMLAIKEDSEKQKSLAFSKLEIYIETNRYLSQDFKDYQLRYGFSPWFKDGVLSFAIAVLKSDYYNDDIRKMGMLLRNYEAIYVPNDIDIMREEQERLYRVHSFDEYKKNLPDKYSFLRKEPPVKFALVTFICVFFVSIISSLLYLILTKDVD